MNYLAPNKARQRLTALAATLAGIVGMSYCLAMDSNKSQLERAFELAGTGRYPTVSDIRKAMSSDGYSTDQVTGSSLLKQIRSIIDKAKTA